MKKPGYLILAGLRRKVMSLLVQDSGNTISFSTSETVATPSTLLRMYSESMHLSILDPRSHKTLSHSFNSRSIRSAQNVIVEPAQGLVYDKTGRLIVESTCWPTSQVKLSFPWKPRSANYPEIDEGIVLSAASYYHWLIEDLPTVLASLRENSNAPLILLKGAPSYCTDFAFIVGRKTVTVDGPVAARNLTLTEKCEDVGWPHPRDIDELTNFGSHTNSGAESNSQQIYISRKFSRRSPANEILIEDLFRSFGFNIVFTEEMTFSEQIQLFGEASFIAGIHGAGLSNMVWAPNGTVVLDIANQNYWTECFHRLAHLKGHIYEHFLYDGAVTDAIDVHSLEQKLVSLGLTKSTESK